jgi:hypothetical protein
MGGEREINCSVVNLQDFSTFYTATWGIEQFREIIQAAGYSRMELHPLKKPTNEILSGQASSEAKNAIGSFHQSFHSPRNAIELVWRMIAEIPRQLKNPIGLARTEAIIGGQHFLLWSEAGSPDIFVRVQEALGRSLPMVFYVHEKVDERIPHLPFAERLVQPYPEMMDELGAKTIDEMMAILNTRGYTGLCLDLHHVRLNSDKTGTTLNPWQETQPVLLKNTKEIHVAVGRDDFRGREGFDTADELKDIIDNTRRSTVSQMLLEIGESGWNGSVVVEVTASSIKSLVSKTGNKGILLREEDWVNYHRQIVAGIQDLLDRGN